MYGDKTARCFWRLPAGGAFTGLLGIMAWMVLACAAFATEPQEVEPLPWYWQNPLPQGNFLEAVSFLDEDVGMVVGRRGDVLHTMDGGDTWFPVETELSNCVRFWDVEYIAEQTAVATASTTCGSGNWTSSIMRTVDGGKTWADVVELSSDYEARAVSFSDEMNGMVVGMGFEVQANLPTWRTTDGGLTWVLSTWNEPPYNILGWHGFAMTDNDTAFAGGISGYLDDDGEPVFGATILRSIDGGETWSTRFFGEPTDPNSIGLFSDFVVAANGRVIAVGLFDAILVSDDGGETWDPRHSGTDRILRSVSCSPVDPSYCIAAGGEMTFHVNTEGVVPEGDGLSAAYRRLLDDAIEPMFMGEGRVIVRTVDGGETWEVVLEEEDAHRFMDVDFHGSGRVTVVGANVFGDADPAAGVGGEILFSNDGGQTWKSKAPSVTDNVHLNSVQFSAAGTGLAVGEQGAIIKSLDGGQTWDELDSGTELELLGVEYTDENLSSVFAVGGLARLSFFGEGVILRTNDSGASWDAFRPECRPIEDGDDWSCAITDISCIDAQQCIAVGNGADNPVTGWSAIFRTEDGGDNWERVFWELHSPPLRSVSCLESGYCFGVGERYFWKSTDFGNSWNISGPMDNSIVVRLDAVQAIDENIVLAAGLSRNESDLGRPHRLIMRSLDGGDSWEHTITPATCTWTPDCRGRAKIDFADESNGVVVGGLLVSRTEDGGETWVHERSGQANKARLRGVSFAGADRISVVGMDGAILSTTGGPTFPVQLQPQRVAECVPDNDNQEFQVQVNIPAVGGYAGSVSLSAAGEPATGVSSTFTPATLTPPEGSSWAVTLDDSVTPGSHHIDIVADDGMSQQLAGFRLDIIDPTEASIALAPDADATDVDLKPEFGWGGVDNVAEYQLQIALDEQFADIVLDQEVSGTAFTPGHDLDPDTQYYWRVRTAAPCDGVWSEARAFITRPAPVATLDPDSLGFTVALGGDTDTVIELANSGVGDLIWNIATASPASPGMGSIGRLPESADLQGSVVNCDNEPGIIIQDDGTVEIAYSGSPSSMSEVIFVDHFIPDGYPVSFRAVCVAFETSGPAIMDFEIVLFDDSGPGGRPGVKLGSVLATAIDIPFYGTEEPGWTAVDISSLGVTIDSGGVYIGARWTPTEPGIFISTDESPGNPAGLGGGYWWNDNSGQWTALASVLPDYRALFVRPVVGADSGCWDPSGIPWLDVSSDSGVTPAGSFSELTVSVDSTGLAAGLHRASLCIFTNDVSRSLIPVPVELVVTENGVALTLEPHSKNLGEVELGSTSGGQAIALRNLGDAGATALDFTLPDGVFEVDTSDCAGTLAAGSSCEITVAFSPVAAGQVSEMLEVSSAQGPSASLTLTGTGIELPAHLVVIPGSLTSELVSGEDEVQSLSVANTVHELNGLLEWEILTSAVSSQPVQPLHAITAHSGARPNSISDAGPAGEQRPADGGVDLVSAHGLALPGIRPVLPAGAPVGCDNAIGLIRNDDGTIENGYSADPELYDQITMVDRFTPVAYPAGLNAVCLSWLGNSFRLSVDFEIVVLDDSGQGASPGVELGAMAFSASSIPKWPVSETAWTSYDISPLDLSIDSGSVYIGVRWQPSAPGAFIAADQSDDRPAGYAGGYYQSGSETTSWSPIESGYPDYRALFIRALSEIDCSLPDWLVPSALSGSVVGGHIEEIEILFDATGLPAGVYQSNLCLASNDPERPLTFIPVSLVVEEGGGAPGELSVAPTELSYGAVAIGDTEAAEVTVSNTGTTGSTLEMSVIDLLSGAPAFQVSGGSCSEGTVLPAGESCTVEVSFSPSALQPYVGVLQIQSTDGQSATVGLSGSGVDPDDAVFSDRFEQ